MTLSNRVLAPRVPHLGLALAALLLTACAPEGKRELTPGTRGGTGGGSGGSGGSAGSSSGAPGSGGAAGSSSGGGSPSGGTTGGGGEPDPAGGSGAPAGGSTGGSGAIDAPAGGVGDGPSAPSGSPIALPLVVTDHFTNRGWFGDGTIAMHFRAGSTIIRETPSTTGPCAGRPPGARGRCLQFTYTPPPGFAAPATGAFVGLYMLPTLRQAHPTASPPARPGDPNWGLEPGIPVAPGARRVRFWAAADQAGTRVSFRAGNDKDNITLPEHTEVLGPAWTEITMHLAGGDTGAHLIGGFAWTLKNTGQPTTFYVDGITWDAEGITPPAAPMGNKDGQRQVMIINKCQQPIWVAIGSQQPVPEGGGFRLDAGQTRSVTFPAGGKWSGRLWGRTGCTFDGAGMGRCETGDCGGRLGCGIVGGQTPATLAEITWSGTAMEPDFYDVSLVDGYNLPMAMGPLKGTYGRNPGAAWDCLVPTCVADLNQTCPAELRVMNGGRVVGCRSACEQFKTDRFCCRGAHDQPETCPPFDQSRTFKKACPTAYSYAYDDATSTFTCKGEDYAVWFCP